MKTKPVRSTPAGRPILSAPVQHQIELAQDDLSLLRELEAKVDKAMTDFWVSLAQIRDHKDGIFWKGEHASFGEYARKRFAFSEQHAGRLAAAGAFVLQLQDGESDAPKPLRESQVRPLLAKLPADHLVRCWEKITAAQSPEELTHDIIEAEVVEYRKIIPKSAQKRSRAAKKSKPTADERARKRSHALIDILKTSTAKLPCAVDIRTLLDRLERLVDGKQPQLTKQVSGKKPLPKLASKPVKKAPRTPRLPEGSRPAKKVSKPAKKPAPVRVAPGSRSKSKA